MKRTERQVRTIADSLTLIDINKNKSQNAISSTQNIKHPSTHNEPTLER